MKSPITFWTTDAQKFCEYELKSEVHKTATLKADNFLKVMQSQMEPVDQQLQSALATEIKLHSISKTIIRIYPYGDIVKMICQGTLRP